MRRFPTTLACGAAALLLAAAGALPLAGATHVMAQRAPDTSTEVDGPNILVNGGFETGADPGVHLELPVGSSPLLAGWTVTNRYVNVMGTYWKAEEGTRSLGMNFDGNGVLANASGIKQVFPTTIGQRYRVVFYQSAISTVHGNVRVLVDSAGKMAHAGFMVQ